MAEPSYEELKARVAELEKKSDRRSGELEFRVGEKGGVSVYGLGRFPVTLYYEQWTRLLEAGPRLRQFLEDNKGQAETKGKVGRQNRSSGPRKSAMKPASRVFEATLERIDSPLKWVMVRIPFDAGKLWGKRGQIKVKGEINGFAFRTSLFPDGNGGHRLLVNKVMQRGGKAAPGMAARFRLEPDKKVRVVAVPAELTRGLREDRALGKWFDGLSRSIRYEICRVVSQAKSPEARLRRATQMAERLLSAMEAEQELPPVLQVALAQNSFASQGWQLMSPLQRRRQLLGVFYYQSPDARARRIAKVVEEAVALTRKRAKRS